MKLFFHKEERFHFFIRQIVGYKPRDISTFRLAFVHKSSVGINSKESDFNERMEFLGDSILGAVVSDLLYKKFPEANEGYMSRLRSELVCRHRLNELATDLGLCEYISYRSSLSIKKTHVPGDVVEALVAAVYLDGGMERAYEFIASKIASEEQIDSLSNLVEMHNYKSSLLEWGQKERRKIIFETDSVELNGGIGFQSLATIEGKAAGIGYGNTKKEAEQKAAKKAIRELNI